MRLFEANNDVWLIPFKDSVALITPHTFEIKESLFTEPLLYLSSGQPGGLYQPVDLSHNKKQGKMKQKAWRFYWWRQSVNI